MAAAVRSKFFTCIGKGHGAPAVPATQEEWEKLRSEAWLVQMCERIKKGDEELKHRLPVWTPHCAEFKDNHRAIADAVKPLNRLMLDFDEKGHTDEIIAKMGLESDGIMGHSTCQPLIPLLVEESVRGGTHVLVEMPEGMAVEEAQELMKQITGFEPDKAVKDVARCIYMVPYFHTRYVNPALFEVDEVQERKSALTSNEGKISLTFKGIPYSSIIAEYWSRTGGEPQEGERNVKLHKLAVNLRAICDNKKDLLMSVMPRFGLSEAELKSVVDSACKDEPKGISKVMQTIIQQLETGQDYNGDDDAPSASVNDSLPTINTKTLPIGLKESLVGIPASMHMPVLCGVLPIAATYADQVEVEYCDGNTHRLGLMSIIRGEQASNKSVVKNVVDIWKRQLDEEDALSRKREEEWKERKKSRKANEKAPDDPHVLIRLLPVTVSCSTSLKRLKNAGNHTLYSFCEELDTLRKTNGAGSWSSKYDVYRMSFDHSEWGQDYNSDQAESGVVKVAYNWTMLGTNGALRKCFKQDNIENGLSSRILVAEMPDSSFSKMIKFTKRSTEDEARIQQAVTQLRSFSGLVDVPRLRKGVEDWVEEKRVEAAKDIDHVKDVYRKRAAVIGFRCGVVFHLLSGKDKESKACIEFALTMAEYCLRQQIAAFGESLQYQLIEARNECQRYSANHSVFDQLPPLFSMDDLRPLKQGFCNESGMRKIISRWGRDNWIEKVDKNHWRKLAAETL